MGRRTSHSLVFSNLIFQSVCCVCSPWLVLVPSLLFPGGFHAKVIGLTILKTFWNLQTRRHSVAHPNKQPLKHTTSSHLPLQTPLRSLGLCPVSHASLERHGHPQENRCHRNPLTILLVPHRSTMWLIIELQTILCPAMLVGLLAPWFLDLPPLKGCL